MNEGKDRAEWWHTASIICSIANANRDKKKRRTPYRVDEIHPWEIRDRKKALRSGGRPNGNIGILKAAFVQKDMSKVEEYL